MASFERYNDLWTGTWGDQQRFGPVHRHQREQLIKLIAKLNVRTILDVGCGSGDNLAAIVQAIPGAIVSGTDLSTQALSMAAQRVPKGTFQPLDAEKERLNEQFDLVLCNQVIEHLVDDIAALRNIARMSKRWVLVATIRGRMRPSERHIGHYRNYSDAELRAKAEAVNLEVVDIFGWGFPFYSPLYRTITEWLPGGPPNGKFGTVQKTMANFLYYLYGLNIPRRGDVVTMLARPRESAN